MKNLKLKGGIESNVGDRQKERSMYEQDFPNI